jgi:hypothetical protein
MSNIKKINNLKGLRTGPLGTATLNAVHAGDVAVHEEACVARAKPKPKPKQEPRNAPARIASPVTSLLARVQTNQPITNVEP